MNRIILVLLFCSTSLIVLPKDPDSLYRSTFERRQISNALNHKTSVDFFALYSSIDSDSIESRQYASRLQTFYNIIRSKEIDSKKGKQKAKMLFKEVHSHFFKQYEENVFFSRIFKDGVYNCVTASMLYALILQNFDIPFEIKETPTHVYLVAFPGSDNIMFETTSPNGFYIPDEKSKRDYVAGLVQLKFTTQEYVDRIGPSKAFNEFYYSKENISLTQLAGIQYYNQAIAFQNDENTDAAINSIMKTNLLYPSPKNTFYKVSLLASKLLNSTMENGQDILYLCEYANASKDNQQRNYVLNVFGQMIDNQLIKNGNDSLLRIAHGIIQKHLDDDKIKTEIDYLYHFGFAQWYYMKSDLDESLSMGEKAFFINPKDVRLQELILRSIILKTEKSKGNQSNVSQLTEYADKFPFLKSNKIFKSLITYQYAFLAYSFFLDDKETEGYKFMRLMEAELQDGKGDMVGQDLIGMVYAEAGAHHFRKKNYTKAKEIILTGLQKAPDHGELKERLEIVEFEMTRKK